MSRLYIIRHGLRLDHEDRRWKQKAARPFDPPLSERGIIQARTTAAYLRDFPIRAVFASPLLRTIQTADPLADALGLPLKLEPGLIEWLNPKWYDFSDGPLAPAALRQRFTTIDLAYPPLVQPRYPEHEEAICRARCQFVARQLAATTTGALALVTHGACVSGIVSGLTGGEGKANEQTCVINVLERHSGEKWRLVDSISSHLTEREKEVSFI